MLLDGEQICLETNSVEFNYSSDWNLVTLGDENGDYLVYLSEGEHTIRMVAILGELGAILQEAENIISRV